jgi:hypothetical protein
VVTYNQNPLHFDDTQKTAITHQFGLFEIPLTFFGLHNAALTFQRFKDDIVRGLTSASRNLTFSFSSGHSRSTSNKRCPDERYKKQNNYLSESIYYTHLWFTPLQKKSIKVYSKYINFSLKFNVGSLGGTTNVQTIFDLVPNVA